MTGSTEGRFRGETRPRRSDAFVMLASANGRITWLRQFGTAGRDGAAGAAVVGRRLVIAGWTGGDLARPFLGGRYDAFVRCLTLSGATRWTRQFGSHRQDQWLGIAATDTGVVLAGRTHGVLPGQTLAGDDDAFLAAYSLRGRHRWTREFGTVRRDAATAVASDGTSIVAIGDADAGLFDGVFDVPVWGYSPDGEALGTVTLRTPGGDYSAGVVLLDDHAYVAGTTPNPAPGSTDQDAFLADVPLPVGS